MMVNQADECGDNVPTKKKPCWQESSCESTDFGCMFSRRKRKKNFICSQ